MRIAIVGGPRHGKSTLADQLHKETGSPVYCCDPKSKVVNPTPYTTYLPEGMKFEEGAQWAAENWFTMPGPWIIEGHSVARSLRYLAEDHDDPRDVVDQVIGLPYAHKEQSDGQRNLSKGVMTVWKEIEKFYEPVADYRIMPGSAKPVRQARIDPRRARTISVDFDGTIHDGYGAAHYQLGDPIPGAFKFLQMLLDEDFDVVGIVPASIPPGRSRSCATGSKTTASPNPTRSNSPSRSPTPASTSTTGPIYSLASFPVSGISVPLVRGTGLILAYLTFQ